MKKIFFTIAVLAITGMVCAQEPLHPKTIEGQSEAAVQKAKKGDVVGAYNTAKRTLMNDDMSKSATHGAMGATQKKVNDAIRERAKKDLNKGSSGSSSNSSSPSGSQTDKTGTTTNGKK